MKMLYIGDTQEIACATFYAEAAEELGYKVFRKNPSLFTTTNPLEKIYTKIFKGPTLWNAKQASKDLISLCLEHSFDTVLNISENFIPPDFILEVKDKLKEKAPLFIYHSHDNNFSKGILKPNHFFKTLTQYDVAFTTKSQNVSKYKELGQKNSFYVPSAYSSRIHNTIPNANSRYKNKTFEIGFVGTYDFSRDKFMNTLGWDNLNVWGNNWKTFKDYEKHQTRISPNSIYLNEFADVINHTKISLGLLREEAEDKHTQRTFEIPACGSFQLAPKNEEILSYFKENKEIVCFSTLEELKDKADYYLRNDTERKKIAFAGHARCLSGHHSYTDRLSQMLEIAKVYRT